MANKKNRDEETNKKTSAKKNNSKSNTTKRTSTSAKKTTTKKKSSSTNTAKKTTQPKKTNTTKNVSKTKKNANIKTKKEENNNNINVIFNKEIVNNTSGTESVKKEIKEEITSINIAKLEEAKYKRNIKNKSLLPIGIIIVILGLAALIISLIANRIIDREFMSDKVITIMMVISVLIEAFGAFIIINES